MTFISQADQTFLSPLSASPKLISRKAMCAKQANGNFVGYWLEKFSDGSEVRRDVIVNAPSTETVRSEMLRAA